MRYKALTAILYSFKSVLNQLKLMFYFKSTLTIMKMVILLTHAQIIPDQITEISFCIAFLYEGICDQVRFQRRLNEFQSQWL